VDGIVYLAERKKRIGFVKPIDGNGNMDVDAIQFERNSFFNSKVGHRVRVHAVQREINSNVSWRAVQIDPVFHYVPTTP
jgi:hypothetical protein